MNKLTAKLKKQGGFTLVEMLIVVAIIAILIAVSIPLVSSALEKAREAADDANVRSFKAELLIGYLTPEDFFKTETTEIAGTTSYSARSSGPETVSLVAYSTEAANVVLTDDEEESGSETQPASTGDDFETDKDYFYNAVSGRVVKTAGEACEDNNGYGQGTKTGSDPEPHKGLILRGSVSANGEVTIVWVGTDGKEVTTTQTE